MTPFIDYNVAYRLHHYHCLTYNRRPFAALTYRVTLVSSIIRFPLIDQSERFITTSNEIDRGITMRYRCNFKSYEVALAHFFYKTPVCNRYIYLIIWLSDSASQVNILRLNISMVTDKHAITKLPYAAA